MPPCGIFILIAFAGKNGMLLGRRRQQKMKAAVVRINALSALLFFCIFPLLQELNATPLIIGSEPDYPPFCTMDENGEASGFSVDLFRASAEAMGYDVQFVVRPWNILLEQLRNGEIDALPLVGYSESRAEYLDFTFPYTTLRGAVFVRRSEKNIHTLEDLKARDILVMQGDNADEYISRNNISDSIIRTDSFDIAFRLLQSGAHDAVIAQRLMGEKLLEEMEIDSIVPLDIELPGFAQQFRFAVTRGNSKLLEDLDTGLLQTISDGTYFRLHTEWFKAQDWHDIPLQEKLYSLLWIIIPVLLILLVTFILYLRLDIQRKTRRLKEEIKQRQETEESLHKLLKEKETLLKEVHHRIKNNFATVESLLSLQAAEMKNDEAKSSLLNSMSRVSSMRLLYDKMLLSDNYKSTSLRFYLSNLIDEIIQLYQGVTEIRVESHIDDIVLEPGILFSLGLMVNELMTNSFKYAFPSAKDGQLSIEVRTDDTMLYLRMQDNGNGLPKNFVLENQEGFGLNLVQMLVEQYLGEFSMKSDGEGTSADISIHLPK